MTKRVSPGLIRIRLRGRRRLLLALLLLCAVLSPAVIQTSTITPAFGVTHDPATTGASTDSASTEVTADGFISGPPSIAGKAVVLMDARTGEILYQRRPRAKRAIASTTKALTALIAIENGDLEAPAVASKNAIKAGGSSLYLRKGHTLTREQLIWALMLRSANDSAIVLAESVSGSVPAFADRMNQRARELGARDSNFTNPNGMPDPLHYSTALDLSRIARHGMTLPFFKKVVGTWQHKIPGPNGAPAIPLTSHNFLLKRYVYASGVKTGYTNLAGNCLISSASKNGTDLILVILGGPSSDRVANDSKIMLEYGFSLYGDRQLVALGDRMAQMYIPDKETTLDVVAERGFVDRLPVDFRRKVVVAASKSMELPIEKGASLGEAIVTVGDRELGRVPLVAAERVDRPSIFQRASRAPRDLVGSILGWFGGLF